MVVIWRAMGDWQRDWVDRCFLKASRSHLLSIVLAKLGAAEGQMGSTYLQRLRFAGQSV